MSFAFVGTYEMYHTFRKSEYKNSWGAPLLLCVAIYPLWYFLGYKGILIALSLSICLALAVFTFKAEMELKDLLATIFSLIYPMALVSLAFALSREFPCGGTFAISFAIFLPVFSDTFAYLVGSTLGKRKLCPSISPKKTVAGAIGGLLGSVLCAVTFFLLFDLYAVIPVGYVTFSDSVAVRAVVFVVLGIVGGFFGQTLQRSFQFLVVGTRKSLHGLWQGGNLFVRNCLHFANPLFYVDYPFDFCAPLAERRQFQSVGAGVGIRRAGII